jgi:phage baseplate assembly protein W
LGADIKVNTMGHFEMRGNHSGDFSTVEGVDNVKQSLLGRLATKLGSLVTRMSFGNSAIDLTGSSYSATFLINLKMALVDTLRKERRVYQVNDFNIRYDSVTSAVIINNLSVQLLEDGQSTSMLTFDPIALPI